MTKMKKAKFLTFDFTEESENFRIDIDDTKKPILAKAITKIPINLNDYVMANVDDCIATYRVTDILIAQFFMGVRTSTLLLELLTTECRSK